MVKSKIINTHAFAYPVTMPLAALSVPGWQAHRRGKQEEEGAKHVIETMQRALLIWNRFIETGEESERQQFLALAYKLLQEAQFVRESAVDEESRLRYGWPLIQHFDVSGYDSWLSALVQGGCLSVLVRGYQASHDELFVQRAVQVAHTLACDILDGGVNTPLISTGIFFEECAVYPATHALRGELFALLGLYDYAQLAGDATAYALFQRGCMTLAEIIAEYDVGFWIYSDLVHKELVQPEGFALLLSLLKAVTAYVSDERLNAAITRWSCYIQQNQWRYAITMCWQNVGRTLCQRVQKRLFPSSPSLSPTRTCVVVQDFLTHGGVGTVIRTFEAVMEAQWHMEYLTWMLGPLRRGKYVIYKFGTRLTTPWHFPFLWLYLIGASVKLLMLQRRGANFQLLLPQDGVLNGALAGIVGKLVGIRVVCVDHGDLSLFMPHNQRILRAERIQALAHKQWPWLARFAARMLLALYWPSLTVLAHISARLADHYLIPGVSDDGVDALCQQFGIAKSRITRFANMIEIERHSLPDVTARAALLERHQIAADAILIAIVCRLAPEKGLEIALAAIQQALEAVPNELRARVRVLIVGDGPSRTAIELDIAERKLEYACLMWGATTIDEIREILGASDIFLYTSWRGAGYPLAILEAMASACAVIATNEPIANAQMLADGRGMVVPIGNIQGIVDGIVQLLNNLDICHLMGQKARAYVALSHSPTMLQRTLLRMSYWSDLKTLKQPMSDVDGEGNIYNGA